MPVDASLARHGGLSYLEIAATDARRSAAFYASVLGWSVEPGPGDQAKFRDATGHLIGRIVGRAPTRDAGLMAYFYVADLDAAVLRVREGGGEVVGGPRAEGDVRVATARDPAGNLLGLWQASP